MEMKIKTTERYHFISVRMAFIKKIRELLARILKKGNLDTIGENVS